MLHAHSSHYNVKEIELAARLGEIVPRPLQKSLFGESGADANEMSMMIARKYTDGFEIASPHISFHGLSDATRAVTFSGWHAGHGHLPGGTYAIVAPYCYRCPLNQTFPELQVRLPEDQLRAARRTDNRAAGGGHHRAAVQRRRRHRAAARLAEGAPGDVPSARKCCSSSTKSKPGLGKLGQMFGFQSEGIVPDIVTVAKHFGGGVGVSAVITSAEIEDKVIRSGYAATHSHANDPLICAAGIASLDVIRDEDVPAKARKIGNHRAPGSPRPAIRAHRRHPRTRSTDGHRACPRQIHQGARDRRRKAIARTASSMA